MEVVNFLKSSLIASFKTYTPIIDYANKFTHMQNQIVIKLNLVS